MNEVAWVGFRIFQRNIAISASRAGELELGVGLTGIEVAFLRLDRERICFVIEPFISFAITFLIEVVKVVVSGEEAIFGRRLNRFRHGRSDEVPIASAFTIASDVEFVGLGGGGGEVEDDRVIRWIVIPSIEVISTRYNFKGFP